MELLSKDLQNAFYDQIYNKAQDLDVAITAYVNGETDFIVDALSLYQKRDGGFGNSLYIDNYNPNSTAFTTFYALKLIYLLDIKEATNMIHKALTYLYHKAYLESDLYLFAEPENNKYAHSDEFEYPKAPSLALTYAIIGLTLLLEDKTYHKLALEKYNKIKNLGYDINKENVLYYAILKAGLAKFNLDNVNIDSSLVDVLNVVEIASFIEVDKSLLDRGLDTLVKSINQSGLWDYNKNWQNKYPEGDVAQIKWLFRASVMNFYYINKYNLLDNSD